MKPNEEKMIVALSTAISTRLREQIEELLAPHGAEARWAAIEAKVQAAMDQFSAEALARQTRHAEEINRFRERIKSLAVQRDGLMAILKEREE